MPENSSAMGQQVGARLAELPQDVRDAILSAELGPHIRTIGQAHALHIDQIGLLEDEVMLVMLGFIEPEAFSKELAGQIRISKNDAEAIAREVNEQIFLPIRESMKRFAESKRTGQQMAAAKQTLVPPPPPPPPVSTATPLQTAPTIPAPATPMSDAEKMMTSTTVTKPIYKTDPYREPIEP